MDRGEVRELPEESILISSEDESDNEREQVDEELHGIILISSEDEVDSDSDIDDNTCAICLNQIDIFIETPCHHKFDLLCLYQWIIRKRSCPYCQSELPNSFL